RRPPRKDDRREDGNSLEHYECSEVEATFAAASPGLLLCPSATRRSCRYQPCSHFKSEVSAPGARWHHPIHTEDPSAALIHGASGTDPAQTQWRSGLSGCASVNRNRDGKGSVG